LWERVSLHSEALAKEWVRGFIEYIESLKPLSEKAIITLSLILSRQGRGKIA